MFVTPAFAQAAPGGAASAFTSFVPLILIFAIMYFLLIRPQQKKAKEHKAMVEALRRGDQIGLLLGSANRDEQKFPLPDVFNPARSPNPHLSFGAGIHFCIGAPLARLELQTALRVLCERLPTLQLDGKARYRDTWHFHALESLPVSW